MVDHNRFIREKMGECSVSNFYTLLKISIENLEIKVFIFTVPMRTKII